MRRDVLKAGDQIDQRYTVLREIGDDEGGMGQIFLVNHEGLNKPMVLKMIRKEILQEDATQARKRFVNEIRSTAQFDHPNIIKITDSGEYQGHLYYIMEHIPGCMSLNRRLQNVVKSGAVGMDTLELSTYLLQATSALEAIHNAGFIHRDLKLHNFLVNPKDFSLKLIDFGIAKSPHSELTAAGCIVGTVSWFSPEEAAFDSGIGDGKNIDYRSDYFKLGVTMYRCLTGQKPFDAKTHEGYTEAILKHDPPPLSKHRNDLHTAWQILVSALMVKDPSQRLSDPSQVITMLKSMYGSTVNDAQDAHWFHGGDTEQADYRWETSQSKSKQASQPIHIETPKPSQPTTSKWQAVEPKTRWSFALFGSSVALLIVVIVASVFSKDEDPILQQPQAPVISAPEMAPKAVSADDILRDREKARILTQQQAPQVQHEAITQHEHHTITRKQSQPQQHREAMPSKNTQPALSAVPAMGESLDMNQAFVNFETKVEETTPKTQKPILGIPKGTRLAARLEHAITLSQGQKIPCSATLKLPAWVSKTYANQSVTLTGFATWGSSQGQPKAHIVFDSASMGEHGDIAIQAIAMSPNGALGISGVLENHDQRPQSNAMATALDVASDVLRGTPGQQITQRFAQDAHNDLRKSHQQYTELSLSASQTFEVQFTRSL